jgi:hypothetical protein
MPIGRDPGCTPIGRRPASEWAAFKRYGFNKGFVDDLADRSKGRRP